MEKRTNIALHTLIFLAGAFTGIFFYNLDHKTVIEKPLPEGEATLTNSKIDPLIRITLGKNLNFYLTDSSDIEIKIHHNHVEIQDKTNMLPLRNIVLTNTHFYGFKSDSSKIK